MTGRRNPGPEPEGSPSSAHQTSPCEITTQPAARSGASSRGQTSRSIRQFHRWPGSSQTSHGLRHDERRTQLPPEHIVDYATFSGDEQVSLHPRTHHQGSRPLSSYQKYNYRCSGIQTHPPQCIPRAVLPNPCVSVPSARRRVLRIYLLARRACLLRIGTANQRHVNSRFDDFGCEPLPPP